MCFSRPVLLIVALLTLLVGCRTNPRATREIALLRSEILDLEDQYYALKSKHRDAVNELRAMRGEPPIDSDDIGCDDCDGAIYDQGIESGPVIEIEGPRRDVQPDKGSVPARSPTPTDGLEEIDLGDGVRYEGRPTHRMPRRAAPVGTRREAVEYLTLDRRITAGHDVDGMIGDEGAVVLIKALDDQGRLTLPAGDLRIVITQEDSDPADPVTIGQWSLSDRDLQPFLVQPQLPISGILLHLPWQHPPSAEQLSIRAIWTPRHGRSVETTGTIDITPPGIEYRSDAPTVVDWINHDVRWMDGSESFREPSSAKTKPESATLGESPRWKPVR